MATFKMPKVDIGDTVLWHIEGEPGEQNAHAAIVTKVYPEHLDVFVMMPGRNGVARFDVRHVQDPFLVDNKNPITKKESGGWSLSPTMKRLAAVEAALQDLAKSRSK